MKKSKLTLKYFQAFIIFLFLILTFFLMYRFTLLPLVYPEDKNFEVKSTSYDFIEYLSSEKIYFEKMFRGFFNTKPNNTERIHLTIKPSILKSFHSNLPFSANKNRKCNIKIEGTTYLCLFKLHAKSFWHWGTKQISYKIIILNNKKNIREFSLSRIKFIEQPVTDLIYNKIALLYDLPFQKIKLVDFKLNNKRSELYILKEELNEGSLVKKGIFQGAILNSEPKDTSNNTNIFNLAKSQDSTPSKINDLKSWKIENINTQDNLRPLIKNSLESLFLHKSIHALDNESFAKSLAINLVIGNHHRNDELNNLFIFNRITEKLSPLFNDIGPFQYPTPEPTNLNEFFLMSFDNSIFQRWFLIKNNKKLLKYYLHDLIYKKNIHRLIKSTLLNHIHNHSSLREQYLNLKAIHPLNTGVFSNDNFFFGSILHSFGKKRFVDALYLNLMAINKRIKVIKKVLNHKPTTSTLRVQTNNPKEYQKTCTIRNKVIDLSQLQNYCNQQSSKDARVSVINDIYELNWENVTVSAKQFSTLILNNIKKVTFKNTIFKKVSLHLTNSRNINLQNIKFLEHSSGALRLISVEDFFAKKIIFKKVWSKAIYCNLSHNLFFENVSFFDVYGKIDNNHCSNLHLNAPVSQKHNRKVKK